MNENKLPGSLLPGHPGFQLILQNIGDKYNLPEISPEDDKITEFLLVDKQIDWDSIRQKIEGRLRVNPEILPSGFFNSLDRFLVSGFIPFRSRLALGQSAG